MAPSGDIAAAYLRLERLHPELQVLGLLAAAKQALSQQPLSVTKPAASNTPHQCRKSLRVPLVSFARSLQFEDQRSTTDRYNEKKFTSIWACTTTEGIIGRQNTFSMTNTLRVMNSQTICQGWQRINVIRLPGGHNQPEIFSSSALAIPPDQFWRKHSQIRCPLSMSALTVLGVIPPASILGRSHMALKTRLRTVRLQEQILA